MSITPHPVEQNQTKIFGLRIGVDPKILVGALIAVTLFFLWYNLRGGDDEHASNSSKPIARTLAPIENRAPVRRTSGGRQSDRAALAVKPVNAASGTIDPTLRLSLLERVKSVEFKAGGRNLFDGGLAVGNLPPVPKGPKIAVKPIAPSLPVVPVVVTETPHVNIPLKYYGFVKPAAHSDHNRGFFMDGDNILVGIEGDVLQSRYLIVSLTPNSARLEDTQMKQGQDLQVSPEAIAQ